VVNVANRTNVDVRLFSFEFSSCHSLFMFLSGSICRTTRRPISVSPKPQAGSQTAEKYTAR
jgi:hypothetical protein